MAHYIKIQRTVQMVLLFDCPIRDFIEFYSITMFFELFTFVENIQRCVDHPS